ncbi:MAG: DUF1727 domain-containing protein [Ruminococcaceae bacterium]|nr:DUF1727 domain-containing protein [Oscillospiraceae bacterium]
MKILMILLCKLLVFVGKLVNKGSSLPGKIVLKLCPDILKRITLPKYVIAVTGSNGKTSTVEMIANVMTENGLNVVWNKEGSNQTEGVTTLLLKNCDLHGSVMGDVVVLESDERYARHTFKHIKPTHFAVTNLYRDQLTRNVHPFWIYDIIKDAADLIPDAELILNADDPIVSLLGKGRGKVRYFAMAKNAYCSDQTDALYNDCTYCPVCGAPLSYEYFHYAHLGKFYCEACKYSSAEPEYVVDSADLENKRISICGQNIELAFASRYNVYNLCTAFAVCSIVGIEHKKIASSLSSFIMKNGRVVRFKAGENEGTLITSKHENSTSYNQSLEYVCASKEKFTLAIIVDAISRKYYTTETSWLWDISFEKLENSNAEKILLCGNYAYDLAARFEMTSIDPAKIKILPDLDEMGKEISSPSDSALYVVTCFSDKEKLFSRVQILNN